MCSSEGLGSLDFSDGRYLSPRFLLLSFRLVFLTELMRSSLSFIHSVNKEPLHTC